MLTTRKPFLLLPVFVVGMGLTNLADNAWCDPLDSSAPLPVAASASEPKALQVAEIKTDPALQLKVSCTAKAQPLDALLRELQTQTHLTFSASLDSPAADLKVTLYIQDLPLSQVLLGLSRLYGVRWTKDGDKSFTLLSSDKGSLETGLMQLGNLDEYRNGFFESMRKSPEHLDWPREVTKHIEEEKLLQGYAPQLSVLPADLISKIRKEKEQVAALRLIEMQHAAMQASIDDYVLRAEVPQPVATPDGKTMSPPPAISVRNQEGKGIASLNPPPRVVPPKGKGKFPNFRGSA